MVEIPRPVIGARLDVPTWQGRSSGHPSAALVIMKNFVRLVRFAWPHRYRFGLSIACAAMIALFFFTELMAVLPLLNILFKNENPQRWISAKIVTIEENIVLLDAQTDEVQTIQQAA